MAAEEAEAGRLVQECVQRVCGFRRQRREVEEARRILKGGGSGGVTSHGQPPGPPRAQHGLKDAMVAVPGTGGAVLRRGVEVAWPPSSSGGSVGVKVGDSWVVSRSARQALAWLGTRLESLVAAEDKAMEELEGLNMRFLLSQYLARQVGEDEVAGEIREELQDDVAFWKEVRTGAQDRGGEEGREKKREGEEEDDGFEDVLARMERLAAEEEEAEVAEEREEEEREAWARFDPAAKAGKGGSPFKAGFLGRKKEKRASKEAEPSKAAEDAGPRKGPGPGPGPGPGSGATAVAPEAKVDDGQGAGVVVASEGTVPEKKDRGAPRAMKKGFLAETPAHVSPGPVAAAEAEASADVVVAVEKKKLKANKPRAMKKGFFDKAPAAVESKAPLAKDGQARMREKPAADAPRQTVHGAAFSGTVVERDPHKESEFGGGLSEDDDDGYGVEKDDDLGGLDEFMADEGSRYEVEEDVEPPLEWMGSVQEDVAEQGFRSVILTEPPPREAGEGPSSSGGESSEAPRPTVVPGYHPPDPAMQMGSAHDGEDVPRHKRISRFKMERIARATMGDDAYQASGLGAPYNGRYNVPPGWR